jgi:hypothetical protein
MLVDVYDTEAHRWEACAVELVAVCHGSAILEDALDQLDAYGAATVVTLDSRVLKITPTIPATPRQRRMA